MVTASMGEVEDYEVYIFPAFVPEITMRYLGVDLKEKGYGKNENATYEKVDKEGDQDYRKVNFGGIIEYNIMAENITNTISDAKSIKFRTKMGTLVSLENGKSIEAEEINNKNLADKHSFDEKISIVKKNDGTTPRGYQDYEITIGDKDGGIKGGHHVRIKFNIKIDREYQYDEDKNVSDIKNARWMPKDEFSYSKV